MPANIRTSTLRSANAVEANPHRLTSADGLRSALGRTVKGESSTPGTWVPVEVWTLKERRDGKWQVVRTHCGRKEAEAWTEAEA